MKSKSILGLLLSLAIFVLPGCGSKHSDSPPPVSKPTSTTAIVGLVSKGPISGATVTAYAVRSGVTDTTALGEAQTDSKGTYTIPTFGYAGPVVVASAGGTYRDEISLQQVTMKVPLRAMFSSVGTGTTTIAVTPLTELAAKMSDGNLALTTDVIDASNRHIADFFSNGNLTNIITDLPFDVPSATANQKDYVHALGVISQLVIDSMRVGDIAAGQSMDDALATVVTTLGGEMEQSGGFSQDSIAKITLATSLFSNGGGTTNPPSTTPPPPTPANGVVKFSTTGTPNPPDNIIGITFTVTLPAGVTVATPVGSNDATGTTVTLAGFPIPKTRTLQALVTQASGTTPGSIAVQVQDTKGVPIGLFLSVNFQMDTTKPFPVKADFVISSELIQGLKLATLTGVTVVPSSLAGL